MTGMFNTNRGKQNVKIKESQYKYVLALLFYKKHFLISDLQVFRGSFPFPNK